MAIKSLKRLDLDVYVVNNEMQEQRVKPLVSSTVVTDLKPPPAEKVMVDSLHSKNGSVKRIKSPITASSYTVAALQTATNSFSQDFLIGEGSLGRVYRAEFPHGKVLIPQSLSLPPSFYKFDSTIFWVH